MSECESLAAAASLACRCRNGVALPACSGQTPPAALGKRFAAACAAIDAARAAGPGKKARRTATRAVRGFRQAAAKLRTKAARQLDAECRDALGSVLGTARDHAVEVKGTL